MNSPSQFQISCILPALNEEKDIRTTVERYSKGIELSSKFSDYEIILVNDGSTDGTAQEIEKLARENPHVRAVHNPTNRGLGYSYRTNFSKCRFEYVLMGYGFVPHTPETLGKMFSEVGNVDVVLAWVPEIRELERGAFRHFVSWCFNRFLNTLFGLNVKYFNGQGIYKRSDLLSLTFRSERSGPHAEATIKLLSRGLTCKEVGFEVIKPWNRAKGSSSLKLANFIYVTRLIFHLILDVKPFFLRKKSLYEPSRSYT